MDILDEIKALADEEKAKHLQRFFKTGKGQYGEGDLFLGITVPVVRSVANTHYKNISLDQIEELIQNPYHEVRFLALMLMVFIYEKTELKKEVFDLYLKNLKYINNWDLVDLSCREIIGHYVFNNKNTEIIYKLADSEHLWSNRVAVVCQYYFLKRKDFSLLLELSEKFLNHKHDLMHKAVGWMLREMGKMDEKPLYEFLDKYHKIMPRTMLRYSLEKLPQDKKFYYMKKDTGKGGDCKVK